MVLESRQFEVEMVSGIWERGSNEGKLVTSDPGTDGDVLPAADYFYSKLAVPLTDHETEELASECSNNHSLDG